MPRGIRAYSPRADRRRDDGNRTTDDDYVRLGRCARVVAPEARPVRPRVDVGGDIHG